MRDGVTMAANVLLPAGAGPFPALLTRTPYIRHFVYHGSRNPGILGWAAQLLENGYALVQVDERGRGDSEGIFRHWVSDADDGYDVVEWVAAQRWCTGRVGMAGVSYKGLTQWWTAQGHPPHLVCIAPTASPVHRADRRPWVNGLMAQTRISFFDYTAGRTHQNPAAPCWTAINQHLPLRTLDQRVSRTRSGWQRWLRHEISYGPERSLSDDDFANLDIPVMVSNGLWRDDELVFGTWRNLQSSRAAAHHRLLVGGWDHVHNPEPNAELGGYDVRATVIDPVGQWRRFFDYWLKGERNGWDREARVRIFRTGAMRWEEWEDWPPDTSDVSLYLHSRGRANTVRGDGALSREAPGAIEPEDTLAYDPADPVPVAAAFPSPARSVEAPLDIRYVERRPDCLVYTGEVLQDALDVSGEVRLQLYVSTDRRDSDVIALLSDVHPDGRSIQVGDISGVRLRYRHPGQELLMTPGRIELIEIDNNWVNHRFLPGHRVRLTITSSYWPRLSRNLNGPENPFDQSTPLIALNSVHHSGPHRSRLLLPTPMR
jgi:putative CocE/NonD family hydrolase